MKKGNSIVPVENSMALRNKQEIVNSSVYNSVFKMESLLLIHS